MKDFYAEKKADYYQRARTEVLPLIPVFSKRVLEVGCGSGATLKWLKEIGRCEESVGIELMSRAAEEALLAVDQVIVADIEEDCVRFPLGHFDLVLCLDVLEHLRDPWRVLCGIVQWLGPGGVLVASVPNIRYRDVLVDLLFRGRFEYADLGILDRTHLRFFTKQSAVALLESSGLDEIDVRLHPAEIQGKGGILNAATLGIFREIFSWQILLRGRRKLTNV